MTGSAMLRTFLTDSSAARPSVLPACWLAAMAAGRSCLFCATCFSMPSRVCVVLILEATFVFAAAPACWTGKHPPKGPARALFRQRTVQTFPVEAGYHCQFMCFDGSEYR